MKPPERSPAEAGPDSSEVYLSNPSVAAAPAVTGRITHPANVLAGEAT